MTVTASSGCSKATASYTVDVQHACHGDTLTISPTKFAMPALTYDIGAPMSTFSWTDSDATSDKNYSDCGGFTWTITQTDGITALDSAIFTEGDYTAATKTIDTETAFIGFAGSYDIRVTVKYTNYPAVTKSLDFQIVLQDYCNTNVVVTPPAALNIPEY